MVGEHMSDVQPNKERVVHVKPFPSTKELLCSTFFVCIWITVSLEFNALSMLQGSCHGFGSCKALG